MTGRHVKDTPPDTQTMENAVKHRHRITGRHVLVARTRPLQQAPWLVGHAAHREAYALAGPGKKGKA